MFTGRNGGRHVVVGRSMDLSGIGQAEVMEQYEQRRLGSLADAELAGKAAKALTAPMATEASASSFVLHAPLELLARLGLLAYVSPDWRRVARLRIVSLVSAYERAGDTLAVPAHVGEVTATQAVGRLRAAISAGELDQVDRVAAWVGENCSAEEIQGGLAEEVVGHLGAAGHANIYLDLAVSGPVARLAPFLLRPMARELAKSPTRAMATATNYRELLGTGSAAPSAVLGAIPVVGPAPARGIAAMVEKAETAGAVAQLLGDAGSSIMSHPDQAGRELLRAAALMMLQGPPDHAPYGWTHCLTLSQAALAQARAVGDASRATAVAAAYVAADWSCLADGPFDPTWAPEPTAAPLTDALGHEPLAAASATWYAPSSELARIRQSLATRAAAALDAHHVKYTLACLRAAAADPSAERLFLGAAAYLASWWAEHPDLDDPLDRSAIGPDRTEAAGTPS